MNAYIVRNIFILLSVLFFSLYSCPICFSKDVLQINECIRESEESDFYMRNCKQYHLWNLKTEGLHKNTMSLSSSLKKDTLSGVKQLISVDLDIKNAIKKIDKESLAKIENLSDKIKDTILSGNKVYIYGCGSTGRLAKQLSFIWRNFWLKSGLKESRKLADSFVGIITGGDRALISSIEGFEDVPLIGALQISDYGFGEKDMIIGVTEGGETSSVIGATLSAKNKNAFFIFNNDEKDLLHLKRSKKVIEDDDITKISLATGAQSITGSTRMQATTTSTFIIGVAMEKSAIGILKKLGQSDIHTEEYSIKRNLSSFGKIHAKLLESAPIISELVDIEYNSYKSGKKVVYTGLSSIVTIFSDITERSPTFGIKAIDTNYKDKDSSIIKVVVMEEDRKSSWKTLLSDRFIGLDKEKYKAKLKADTEISSKLQKLAIEGLPTAGNRQQYFYDFSYKNLFNGNDLKNIGHFFIYLLPEDFNSLEKLGTVLKLLNRNSIPFTVLNLSNFNMPFKVQSERKIKTEDIKDTIGLNSRVLLKMILNTQSTAAMAKLGHVVGNIMTHLKPANLKLIGRATNIIRHIVNYKLSSEVLSYNEANRILFDAMDFKKTNKHSSSEISLSIVKLLESFKVQKCISFSTSQNILSNSTLEEYLDNYSIGN